MYILSAHVSAEMYTFFLCYKYLSQICVFYGVQVSTREVIPKGLVKNGKKIIYTLPVR